MGKARNTLTSLALAGATVLGGCRLSPYGQRFVRGIGEQIVAESIRATINPYDRGEKKNSQNQRTCIDLINLDTGKKEITIIGWYGNYVCDKGESKQFPLKGYNVLKWNGGTLEEAYVIKCEVEERQGQEWISILKDGELILSRAKGSGSF